MRAPAILRRLALLLTALALAPGLQAQGPIRELDPDAPGKRPFTAEDVRRWMPVGPEELACPIEEFRPLARSVAAGTTDVRLLRAYSRFEARLNPFDFDLPPDLMVRATAHKRRLAAETAAALPDPGCWVPLGPRNIPGRMVALEVHPTDLDTMWVAGADGGLWKTTDRGVTWVPLSDFEAVLSSGGLAVDPVDPNVIYLGTGEGNYAIDNRSGVGLLKTTDGGANWTLIPVSTLTTTYFHQIAIDPDDRSSIWAATTVGLYHSTDSGQSWALAGNGYPAEDTTAIVISAKRGSNVILAADGRGSSASNGVWRSPDGGASWALVPSIPAGGSNGRIALAVSRSNPDRLYASIANRSTSRVLAMYRSDDEGQTWSTIPTAGGTNGFCSQQCWYDMALAVDAADPDLVYAAGLDNYRSTNGGQSWSRITSWTADPRATNYAHADQHAAVSPAADVILVANDGGINLSRDRGATWEFIGESLETAQYYHISTDATDDAWAITGAQDNGTQKFSGSFSWQEVIGGDGFYTAIDWNEPKTWYGSLYYLTLFRSRDRGNGFVEIATGIPSGDTRPFISRFFLDRSNPRNVFACTQRLWKSTDQGDTFTDISAPVTLTSRYLTAVETCRDDGNTIYVGTRDGKLWVTRDGGANWTDRSAGLPGRFVTSVSVHPSDPLTAFVSISGYTVGEHIWKTVDGGQTWSDVSAALPNIHFNQVLMLEDVPTTLVAASDIGVFWSVDGGATWGVLGKNLPNVAVDWLAYAPQLGTLRAGTHGRGAWQLVTPTSCALLPEFSGLESIAVVDAGAACQPELRWSPARSNCALAPAIHYNVYRSTDPLFAPGPATLLQAGLTGTIYVDASAIADTPYYYIVRAEDGQTGFPGPSNGGKEDKNSVMLHREVGDPFATGSLADDGGDTDAWLASGWWSVSDGANATPGGRWSYRSAPVGSPAYTPNVCSAIETPDMVLGSGATLDYQASYNIEHEWDGVVVEISTDGGSNWTDLPPVGGYPSSLAQTQGNACGLPATRAVFSGPSGNGGLSGFAAYTTDLGAWAGQTVRVRWLFTSDPGAEFEGFFLDDVRIGPATAAPGGCEACAPGAPGLVGNSLRMGRPGGSGAAIRAYWTSLDVEGRWNLHATADPASLAMLWQNMASRVASSTTKVVDESAPGVYPDGFFQVYAADNCTEASVP